MGPPVANSYPFLNSSLAYLYSWADTLSVQLPQLRWPGDSPSLPTFLFPVSAVSLAPVVIRLLVQNDILTSFGKTLFSAEGLFLVQTGFLVQSRAGRISAQKLGSMPSSWIACVRNLLPSREKR